MSFDASESRLFEVPLVLIGALELFSVALIAFEFVAMVSNGRAYAEIRENIIAEVNRASRSAQQHTETIG
jgi:hypothetical protein